MDPQDLETGETSSSASTRPGGRLSRLAQALGKKKAEKDVAANEGNDWLAGLRSDNPPPAHSAPPAAQNNAVAPAQASAETRLEAAQPASLEAAANSALAPSSPAATPGSTPPEVQNPVETASEPASGSSDSSESIEDPATSSNPALADLPEDTTLPEWLKDLKPKVEPPAGQRQTGSGATPAQGQPEIAGAIPQWLLDFAAASSALPVFPEQQAPPVQEPAAPASPVGASGEEQEEEAELPDWLRDARPGNFKAQEAEAPQKNILEWLKGPDQPPSGPSEGPTFGDVDVEERLNFAFDEPGNSERPTNNAETRPAEVGKDQGRQQSGLTHVLGFSPYAQDENQSPFRWQDKTSGELEGLAETGGEFPAMPDFLAEPSFVEQAEILPAAEPANHNLPFWLNGLKPPALDASTAAKLPTGQVGVAGEGSQGTPPPSRLAPWLEGLPPPELEASATLLLNLDELLNNLPPIDKPAASDLPAGNPQAIREKGTRPFSVGAMFHQTDYLSERFIGEGASQKYPEEEPNTPELSKPAASQAGPASISDLTQAGPEPVSTEGENASGFVSEAAPSEEASPDWLSMLPAIPDLPVEEADSLTTDTGNEATTSPGIRDELAETAQANNGNLEDFTLLGTIKPASPVRPEELPSLASLDEGKPPTFELPDFLTELDQTAVSSPTPAQPLPENPAGKPRNAPENPAELANPVQPPQGGPSVSGENAAAEENSPASSPNMDSSREAPTSSPAQAQSAPQELAAAEKEPPPSVEESSPSEWATPWEGSVVEEPAQAAASPETEPAPPPPEADADMEAANDIPPWLKALSDGGLPEVTPTRPDAGYSEMKAGNQAEATPAATLPDWLRDDTELPPATPIPAETASAGTGQPSSETAPNPVQPKGATVEDRDLPEWLKETSAAIAPATIPDFPGSTELPDWLQEPEAPALTFGENDYTGPNIIHDPNAGPPVDYSSLLEETPSNVPGQFSGSNFFGEVEGPAWLRQTNQPKPPEPASGVAPAAAPGVDPAVPHWLRSAAAPTNAETALPPVNEETQIPPASQAAEDEPPAAEAVPEPEEELPSVHLPPQLASAAVLAALLEPPPAAQIPVSTRAARGPLDFFQANIVRYILSILLIGVALVGLLQPLPVGSLPISANVQTFYDQIDQLPPNSKVLVAFDWEADRNGEMGPLSTSVVQHIMAKRARLVTLSLNPQGPALAARITDELATNAIYGNSSFYKYGNTYLNLGWRSGQEAALRSLFDSMGNLTDYKNGQRAADLAATSGINSLNDFDLIVVLAGDEGSVRAWVEQVGVQPGSRLILGVPLAVEPVARPYAQGLSTASQDRRTSETQPRAKALLAGLNQTAQYDQLLLDKLKLKTDPTASLEGRLSAQSLAALLLIVVIIIGNVLYLVRRRR